MDFIYQVGDIVEITETLMGEAVYNNKRQIINSHWPKRVSVYYCEVLEIKTDRLYFGGGRYEEFQVATVKYLDRKDMDGNNRINRYFTFDNKQYRTIKLYKR